MVIRRTPWIPVALLILCSFLPGRPTSALTFSNSFESCSAAGWNGAVGNAAYVTDDCQDSACCGRQTIAQGATQGNVMWYKSVSGNPTTVRMEAWWRFPVGWLFGTDESGTLKTFILETSNHQNRMFGAFIANNPLSARLALIVEGPNAQWKYFNQGGTEPRILADGAWHHVEVLWSRVPGVDAGHVRALLDGHLHIDTALTTCNGSCPSITEFKVGAYHNWTSPQTQSFYLDNVRLELDSSSAQCGDGTINGLELCDSGALAGTTCTTLGFVGGGSLSCAADCLGFNVDGCIGSNHHTCSNPHDDWIVCDDFESGTLAYWNDDLNTGGGALTIASTDAYEGSRAAVMSYTPEHTSAWAARFFGDHPLTENGGPPVSDIYVKQAVRFSSLQALAADSTKIGILAAFQSWNASFPGPNSWAPYYATLFVDTDGSFSMETHSKTSGESVWRNYPQNMGSPVIVQPGKWYDVQYRLRLNDPGLSNGILEYWVDGAMKASYHDVNFRDSYTLHTWNQLLLSAHQDPVSTPHAQKWDSVIGSRTFITSGGESPSLPGVNDLIRTDTVQSSP